MTLPIAIILPHAGLKTPQELVGRVALTEPHIFNEADIFTEELFNYRDQVLHWVSFPYARAIIDVNRAEEPSLSRPGDGIVKRQTSYGVSVYHPGQEPDAEMERLLINRYWRPWHEKLAAIAGDTRVKLVLDCHSMAAIGPSAYTDANPNQVRPRVSISNLGDWDGDARTPDQRISADPHVTRMLAVQLGKNLDNAPTLASVGARSAVNTPYIGGYDIAAHGGRTQPWLMLEVNRALYVGTQSSDTPVTRPNLGLIDNLREKIWQAIQSVFQNHFLLSDE